MHGTTISTLDRARFLSLLERASTLMIDFDADGLNDSVGAMAEAIDGLRNHPYAREDVSKASENGSPRHIERDSHFV